VTPTWVQVVYLACAVCFILALKGLSGPKTARSGNIVGAVAAVVAIILPFVYLDLKHVWLIVIGIVLGAAGGVVGARKVQMTQMPQMVALFNGVGGGAAALVALLELHERLDASASSGWFILAATAFTIAVGAVSFAGSAVTFAKLQELMTSRPVVFPGLPVVFGATLVAVLVLGVLTVTNTAMAIAIVLAVLGLLGGIMLVLPVGGANDVVNPAAKSTPGAPIYGMPILNADEAKAVVFMKRSMRPGFAGIENELLFEERTSLLFGDAKDSMSKLLNAVKAL
jgi:NAD(P) transhydrogenase subunit beta